MIYMGSKNRIAKDILPIILDGRKDDSQWYVEPFCGGMNSMQYVTGNRIASDSNYYLMEMWRALLESKREFGKYSRDAYNRIRDNRELFEPGDVGWVGFNCSYSGKFFGGFSGETKTKDGTVRDYQQEAINNVYKQLPSLQGVILQNKNYFDLHIPDNSIVYCDPPYSKSTKYMMCSEFDHKLFWQWVRNKSMQGHSVFVSEYSAPPDFECLWEKSLKSSLSANGKSGYSKVSTERLFKFKG